MPVCVRVVVLPSAEITLFPVMVTFPSFFQTTSVCRSSIRLREIASAIGEPLNGILLAVEFGGGFEMDVVSLRIHDVTRDPHSILPR